MKDDNIVNRVSKLLITFKYTEDELKHLLKLVYQRGMLDQQIEYSKKVLARK